MPSPAVNKPTNENMPAHTPPNSNVEGCFEITLARSLARDKQPLQIQEAISKHGLQFSRLVPSKRIELAAALQWEYRRRVSWIQHDEASLQTLQHQYKQVRDFVTPIYRLPAEILTEIFTIDFERDQPPIRLMLVCRDWCLVVEGMASMWQSLKLGTWTPPERVVRFLQKAWRLNIVIHTEENTERREGDGEAYAALVLVLINAYRWRRLTIETLPDGSVVPSVSLPPINGLKYLKVASQAKSSLLDRILENIGRAAVGSLSMIETTSYQTIRYLLQPAYIQLFHFITTLKADIQPAHDSVDLLPHLSRVEVLDMTNVSLPPYADDIDMPLVHSLRQLRLKAVSIQWMGGRKFPQLQSCLINSPTSYPPLLSDVYFPICQELEFGDRSVEVAERFRAPAIYSMTMKSNEWTPLRGSRKVVLLCRAGLGIHWQPRVLHLSVLCSEGVLLSALRLLPALNELQLDISRPCVLGRRFFMALHAKPVDDPNRKFDRKSEYRPKDIEIWESRICPSLRRLELKYKRWLRRTDQLDVLPPLLAIGWSRWYTSRTLESFRLCFKRSDAQWKVLKLHRRPRVPDIAALDIPQLEPFQGFPHFFESCVTASAAPVMNHTDDNKHGLPDHLQHTLPIFGSYFRQLNVLRIHNNHKRYSTFDILPAFFQLEELALTSVDIPPYSINAGLPLFQTLLRLTLRSMSLTWMDGYVFTRLKRLHLDRVSFNLPFSVTLPECTHIKYVGGNCHLSQSIFRVPTLMELDMYDKNCCDLCWENSIEKGTLGLLPTRTLVLQGGYSISSESLVAGIASLVELEVLSITSNRPQPNIALLTALGRTIAEIGVPVLRTACAANAIDDSYGEDAGPLSRGLRNLFCPNLTHLSLWISGSCASKECVMWQCEKMMDVRKCAGQELKYCRVWWSEGGTPFQ